MYHFWKKLLALCLSVLPVLGMFTGCSVEKTETTTEPMQPEEPTTTTDPEPTENPEEAKVLKFLTIGHSLALDSCHMLNLILSTEGFNKYEEIVIGTLYSGKGRLSKHVEFMLTNSPEYDLYISSTKVPDNPPSITKSVTAKDAIVYDHWDIIIMQGGATENPQEAAFTDNKIASIQSYVNKYKTNPDAVFAWHMPWAAPVDNDLRDMYPYEPNTYYTVYEQFNHQRSAFYEAAAGNVRKYIATNDTFRFVIPTGTAIENALSSYIEEKDLHRDYVHASDYGRFIAAYTWYCKIMGIDKLDQIRLNAIPKAFLKSTKDKTQDRPLTDMEKAIALEAINNALAKPYEMTQSQYTTKPAE